VLWFILLRAPIYFGFVMKDCSLFVRVAVPRGEEQHKVKNHFSVILLLKDFQNNLNQNNTTNYPFKYIFINNH